MNRNQFLNKKEVISIRKIILANSTDTIIERIKGDGTVEGIKVKFYQGQQRALHVMPFIEHRGARIEHLVTYPATADKFLSGENDNLDLPCVVSVDNDDYFKVSVVNTDPVNDYTLVLDAVIDYYAGKERVIGGLI